MKQYVVILRGIGKTEVVSDFTLMSEVKQFLHSKGFYWCKELHMWEQCYLHVDPYSSECDEQYTFAEVIEKNVESGAVVDRQVA